MKRGSDGTPVREKEEEPYIWLMGVWVWIKYSEELHHSQTGIMSNVCVLLKEISNHRMEYDVTPMERGWFNLR